MPNLTEGNFYWQDVNGNVHNMRDPQGKRLCIVSRNQTSGLFRIFYEFGTGEPRTSLDLISAQKLAELSLGFDPGGSWSVKSVLFHSEQVLVLNDIPVTWNPSNQTKDV